jgi:hypothetical protein
MFIRFEQGRNIKYDFIHHKSNDEDKQATKLERMPAQD